MSCLGAIRGARGFRTSNCCGIGVLRTLRDAFFTICLAVSLPGSHSMPQVRGKMIKKTPGPVSRGGIPSGAVLRIERTKTVRDGSRPS